MARRRPVVVDGGGCVSDVDTLEFVSLGSKNISRPTGPLLSPGQALGSGRSTQRRGTARHGRIAGQVWSGRYAVQFVTLACTLSFRHQQNSVSKSFPGRHLEIPNHLVTVSNPRQITTTGLFPSREGKKSAVNISSLGSPSRNHGVSGVCALNKVNDVGHCNPANILCTCSCWGSISTWEPWRAQMGCGFSKTI